MCVVSLTLSTVFTIIFLYTPNISYTYYAVHVYYFCYCAWTQLSKINDLIRLDYTCYVHSQLFFSPAQADWPRVNFT